MQHSPANKMRRHQHRSILPRKPLLGLNIPVVDNVLSGLLGNGNAAPASNSPLAIGSTTVNTPSGGQSSIPPQAGGNPNGNVYTSNGNVNTLTAPSVGGSIPSNSGLPMSGGSPQSSLSSAAGNGLGSGSQPSSTRPSVASTPVVNVGGALNVGSVPANGNPSSGSSGTFTTPGPINPSYTFVATSTGSTGIITGSGGGGGTVNGSGPAVSNATSKPGISSGAIAGIVVALIAILGFFIIFFVRRRYRARRNLRLEKWLAYGNTPGANSLPRSGFSSTRSSFASPDVDNAMNSQSLYIHEHAQLSEKLDPVTMSGIAAPPVAVVVEHIGGASNRNSVYSIGSDSSGGHSDSSYVYLSAVSAVGGFAPPLSSPMSVRPFTPSESWSFPKPPVNQAATLIDVKDSSTDEHGNFASVETIMRPFIPSMSDELPVEPGNFIRVIKSFDDGWALVEKFESSGHTVTGLIPLDCLRPSENRARSPSVSKRFSSYRN